MKNRIIGLTGGIASGKTLVENYLSSKDIPVEDADAVVHRLLREDETLKNRIREAFGEAVFNTDGQLDRSRLAELVFQDAKRRTLLESWIHPAVRMALADFCRQHANQSVVVVSIPLLFESRLESLYPEIWLVVSDEKTRLDRLMTRRHMPHDAALARIRSQMPLEEKIKRLASHGEGHIIRNIGHPEDVYRQVDALLSSATS